MALEHVGGGGAYDGAEPDDDRDLPWYAALTSCTGLAGRRAVRRAPVAASSAELRPARVYMKIRRTVLLLLFE